MKEVLPKIEIYYFTGIECNVCKVLKPKIEDFITQKFPKIKLGYVNSEVLPDIAAQNRIFSVPTILLIFDGFTPAFFISLRHCFR